MTLISREEALSILGPVAAHLRDCYVEAWSIYQQEFRRRMPLASVRGIATTVNELVIERVREHSADMPTVRVRDNVCGGRFILEVDNQLIVYFKKVTEDFRTTNNPTENSEAFDLQVEIDGFPAWPRVLASYALGELGTEMEGPYLAFLIGKDCQWFHDLNDGDGTGVLPFPDPDKLGPDREGQVPERPAIVVDGDIGGD